MPKKVKQILNVAIGAFIGVFIGHAIYQTVDYITHPALYQFQSAPWYTSIQLQAVFTAVAVGIAVAVKLLIRKKN